MLHSGDVVNGPFASDAVAIGEGDQLTVVMTLTNLGSTNDANDQLAAASKITERVVEFVVPIVGAIVGGPEGFQIGDVITNELGRLASGLSDFLDSIGFQIGPANCNGEVFNLALNYSPEELQAAAFQPASQTLTGSQDNSKCGDAPHTRVNFRIVQTLAASLIFYKRSTGQAFTSEVLTVSSIAEAKQIGVWEKDWTQISAVEVNGRQSLLVYRNSDGNIFTAPVVTDAVTQTIGVSQSMQIGAWDKDWSTITSFQVGGETFLLLYKQTTGQVFTAPMTSISQVGAPTQIGVWDRDWATIAPFVFNGETFLLLYKRSTGQTFSAPIVSATQVGQVQPIGSWDTDWAIISPFRIHGASYLLLYKQTTGQAFTAEVLGGSHIGDPTQIGSWDRDWDYVGALSS